MSLQTNYYDVHNMYLQFNTKHWDMAGQLAWLEEVFRQIKARGEKVVIIGHERPGEWMKGVWPMKMQWLLEQYAEIVLALMYGHEHNNIVHVVHERASWLPSFKHSEKMVDYFSRHHYYNKENQHDKTTSLVHGFEGRDLTRFARGSSSSPIIKANPLHVEYIPSSVTPADHSTNPSFGVLYLRPRDALTKGVKHGVREYQQFRFDLDMANSRGWGEWQNVYNATSEYRLSSLNADTWHDVGLRMLTDNSMKDKYVFHYKGGHEHQQINTTNLFIACHVLTSFDDEREYCLSTLTPEQ